MYSGLRYAGYQAFVVAIVLSASDTLKSDKAINKSMTLGIILNGLMITLSCIMLLAWMPGAQKETIPILYICKRLNSGFLLFSYSVVLFLAFVSTGIGCVFGAVARFEHVFKKPENIKKRRGLISLVCMVLSMAISLFGLTKIVVVGYGYVGIIGIFAVVIPCIVVGRIKNNRFKKEKESILLEEQNDISNEYQNSASVEDKSDMLKEKDSELKEEQDNISKKDKDIASKEDKDDVLKEEDSELIEDQDDISEEDEENVPVEDQVDVLKGEQDSVPEDADDTLEEDKESVSIEDKDDILKEEQDSVSEGEDDTLKEDKENVAVEGQDNMQKEDKESISIEEEKSTDDDASKEDEDNISVEDQDNI